ncbi:flagellar export protein FliJ [Cerasibacillus terrae]|uniref:Flagellar FliJ protein n=1 Tax=Cerasibacillus terrae TaxID=2498845 RepID=A0A5C8P292_9BACI|nr:flagellar export protein FliJ [Cerasibacillus terrae]TXL67681.1 flagellar export protein FliJ [Cerasibacillus terrae]
MPQQTSLSKLLILREREKDDAQKAYHLSMETFEDVASKLYKLLKRKENVEEEQDTILQTKITIEQLRIQNAYIEKLTKQIAKIQNEVQIARNDMELKQSQLTDAYIEMKKYEKIIELQEEEEKKKIKHNENMAMDEISMRQYISTR